MQPTSPRVAACRCFPDARPALRDHGPRPAGVVAETPVPESDCLLSLRPDVSCLQRWLDLNA